MTPMIDKEKTGRQIRTMMEMRGIKVRDVKDALSLGCEQTVYHWLEGKSIPSLDNLYALSELLRVPMDMLIRGDRFYEPVKDIPSSAERFLRYYRMLQGYTAA